MRTQVIRTAAFTGLLGAALLLTFGSAAQAQFTPTVASDRGAGFIVFPKVLSDPNDVLNRGETVETLIQLTNIDPNTPRAVQCFYVNATGVCTAGTNVSGGLDCLEDEDCGVGGRCNESIWDETNFTFILTQQQPTGWVISEGRDVDVVDGNETGVGEGRILAVPTDLFRGELKCVEVDSIEQAIPINRNDLKGEASTYVVQREPEAGTCLVCNCNNVQTVCEAGVPEGEEEQCIPNCLAAGGIVGGGGAQVFTIPCSERAECPVVAQPITSVDVRRYNAIGIQAVEEDGEEQNDRTLCLGGNGIEGNVCEEREYAECPERLIVNHLFADEETRPNVTLVPCTEQLTTEEPTNLTIQILVFNEFEQRFSLTTRVECLADIDLAELSLLFTRGAQGTVAGQSIFRAVADSSIADGGFGLLGIAEQFTDQGSTAYNVVYSGNHEGVADFVSFVFPNDGNEPENIP